MSDKFHWGDTTSVSRNGVTVERELEGREDGIIVTMDLHADVSGPLRVDVVDEFPADLPAEQAGFNVEYEPDDGDLTLERAKISHTIEDDTARIVYAIRLSEPVSEVSFGEPTVEDVTLPGLSGSDADRDDESAEATPEPSEAGSMSFDSSGFESSADSRDGAASHDGPPTEGGGHARDAIERAVAETERSDQPDSNPPGGWTGFGDDAVGEDAAGDGPTEEAADDATADDAHATEESGSGPPARGDRSGSAPSARDDRNAGRGSEGGPTDPTSEESTDEGPTNGTGRDAAGRSDARSPSSGSPGGPRRGAGGETDAADRGPSGDEEISRSVRLRLDRLNARVEEFATYAEALEDIIEREGTGPEIIENLESNLSEATERLEEVREDVDSLQSEHAADVSSVRDRIDTLEGDLEDVRSDLGSDLEEARSDLRSDVVNVRGTVDDVGADVERVDHETSENADEIEGVRDHLEAVESAVHSLDDRVDDHEDAVEEVTEAVESVEADLSELSDSVDAMRSELEAVQVDVDRLLRFREILADVFGGPVQRITEDDRESADLSGSDSPGDGDSLSTTSEPSR